MSSMTITFHSDNVPVLCLQFVPLRLYIVLVNFTTYLTNSFSTNSWRAGSGKTDRQPVKQAGRHLHQVYFQPGWFHDFQEENEQPSCSEYIHFFAPRWGQRGCSVLIGHRAVRGSDRNQTSSCIWGIECDVDDIDGLGSLCLISLLWLQKAHTEPRVFWCTGSVSVRGWRSVQGVSLPSLQLIKVQISQCFYFRFSHLHSRLQRLFWDGLLVFLQSWTLITPGGVNWTWRKSASEGFGLELRQSRTVSVSVRYNPEHTQRQMAARSV